AEKPAPRSYGVDTPNAGAVEIESQDPLDRVSNPLTDLLYLRGRLGTVAHGTASLGRCAVGASRAVASEAPSPHVPRPRPWRVPVGRRAHARLAPPVSSPRCSL